MFGLGTQELIVIFLIVFVLFGAKKLPEMGKGIGEGIRSFKKSIAERDEPEADETKKNISDNKGGVENKKEEKES